MMSCAVDPEKQRARLRQKPFEVRERVGLYV